MFTSQIEGQQNTQSEDSGKKTLTSVCGVDVSEYKCYELNHDDPVYKQFDNSTMHYAINAMQKGLKPPTKIGIKRLKKKAIKKKLKLQNPDLPDLDPKTSRRLLGVLRQNRTKYKIKAPPAAKPLNPLSPEEVCLKALRTKFREEMEQTNQKNQNDTVNNSKVRIFGPKALLNQEQKQQRHKNRKPKFIRKKQNQKKRRAQLLYLVHQYGTILKQIFPAQRLQGFYHRSKLPKISRQQIKQALTKYFNEKNQILGSQEKMTQVVEKKFKQLQKDKKNRQKRYRIRRMNSGSDNESQQDSSSSSSSSSSQSSPEGSQRNSQSQAEQEESQPMKRVKVN